MPKFVEPQLCQARRARAVGATAGRTRSSSTAIACSFASRTARPRCSTRKGLDWTEKFAAIAKQAKKLPDCIIDGEAVALDKQGAPDFAALQAALSEGKSEKLIFFAFDLLFLEGEDLRPLPLSERKERLKELLRRPAGKWRPALRRSFRDGGRRRAAIGLPHASRRHRLEGARCALPVGPRWQLDQGQVPRRPRGDHRRLDQRRPPPALAAGGRPSRRGQEHASSSMSAGSAPASARA